MEDHFPLQIGQIHLHGHLRTEEYQLFGPGPTHVLLQNGYI